MDNPVQAALSAYEHPLISKIQQDLPWRQKCVLGLAAGEQDPLVFLLDESVGDLAGAAFTAISRGPPARFPFLQRLRIRSEIQISPQAFAEE